MNKTRIAVIDVGTTKVGTIMGTIEGPSGLRIPGAGMQGYELSGSNEEWTQ
jgi:hypothetical protein